MSVVLYFGLMGGVILMGSVLLGLTFRHWYLESKKKEKTREGV